MLAASAIEEQLELYATRFAPRLSAGGFLGVVGSPRVLKLLGVPQPQRELVARTTRASRATCAGCLDHVVAVALLRENYFWSVYIRGRYTRERLPRVPQAGASSPRSRPGSPETSGRAPAR